MRTLSALTLAAVVLAGCSGVRTVSSDVSSFGDWPAERKPASYAFDRLPSQQALGEDTDRLEAAARPALERAGFTPAPDGQVPDVLVQVGARMTRYDRYYYWNDAMYWRGGYGYGYGYWRYGPWPGPYWGMSAYYDYRPRYDREVALLLRDNGTGKPLFEARASNDSGYGMDSQDLQAMFEAALMDFPRLGVNPRRVVVAIPPVPPQ